MDHQAGSATEVPWRARLPAVVLTQAQTPCLPALDSNALGNMKLGRHLSAPVSPHTATHAAVALGGSPDWPVPAMLLENVLPISLLKQLQVRSRAARAATPST